MSIEEPEVFSWTEIDERINAAVMAERAKWQHALHGLHCEVLETIRLTVERTLDRSEALTADAVARLLASTQDLLKQFDAKVRACLEQDRRMLDVSPRDRSIN